MPKKITEKQVDEIIRRGPDRILAKAGGGTPEQKPDIMSQLLKTGQQPQ